MALYPAMACTSCSSTITYEQFTNSKFKLKMKSTKLTLEILTIQHNSNIP